MHQSSGEGCEGRTRKVSGVLVCGTHERKQSTRWRSINRGCPAPTLAADLTPSFQSFNKMRLTIIAPESVYELEVDPSMEMRDVKALVEAEVSQRTSSRKKGTAADIRQVRLWRTRRSPRTQELLSPIQRRLWPPTGSTVRVLLSSSPSGKAHSLFKLLTPATTVHSRLARPARHQ